MRTRTFRLLVSAAVALGLAVRLASVLTRPHLVAAGDPYEYLGQANLLAAGHGWIEPYTWAHHHVAAQTAKLPPLYTMLMALCSLAGWKSFLAHRIWSAVLSATGVAAAAGLGREVAGRPVAVLAAFGVALYPNMWMSAGLGMSETISPVLVAVVLWLAYRAWLRPTVARAVALGVTVGVAGLARDELLVFVALIIVPLAVGAARRRPATGPGSRAVAASAGGTGWRATGGLGQGLVGGISAWRAAGGDGPGTRTPPGPARPAASGRGQGRPALRFAGAGAVAALAVVAPWVAWNMSRFSHPVLISDRFGLTLASANCDTTYSGWSAGYWSLECAAASVRGVHGDESADDPVATRVGFDYIRSHLSDLPRVEYDRLGRTFGFYRIRQQMQLDIVIESRPSTWAWVGLWSYYGLVLAAPLGVWQLRRRGVPLFPLAAVLADVVLVTLITYGQTRFRATLEPVLVLLAAVALASLVRLPLGGIAGGGHRRPPGWPTEPGRVPVPVAG